MSVRLRLAKTGRKGLNSFRIVAIDQRAARDSRYIDLIGRYQPMNPDKEQQVIVDAAKALDWLKKGAQPTDTVKGLFRKKGVLKAFHEYTAEQHKVRKAAAGKN